MAKVSRLTLSQYKQNSRAVYKAYTTRLYEYLKELQPPTYSSAWPGGSGPLSVPFLHRISFLGGHIEKEFRLFVNLRQ